MSQDPAVDAAAVLEHIRRYNMPFGMFGPKHYPPKGVPIYDLPAEYLAWFALKGFPEGRLASCCAWFIKRRRTAATQCSMRSGAKPVALQAATAHETRVEV